MYRALFISLIFMSHTLTAQVQKNNITPLSQSEIQGMTWVEAMQDYRVNFHTVVDKFNDEFAGKPYEKGRGMKQFKRWPISKTLGFFIFLKNSFDGGTRNF